MKRSETISVLLIGNNAATHKFLDSALSSLGIDHSILAIPDISALCSILDIASMWRPQLLFFDAGQKHCMNMIRAIRSSAKYDNVTIAVCDPMRRSADAEEWFAAGVNICISKPAELRQLESILKKVIAINWQYFRGNMNRETFFLSV